MKKRIIFDLVVLAAIFYTPWWVVAILGFMGAFYCKSYYEIFIFGLIVDLLYGAKAVHLGGVYGIVSALIIFITASYAKKAVR